MKNDIDVKIQLTRVKLVIVDNNNVSNITDEMLVGKYSITSAKRYIKSGNYSSDFDNVKFIDVLEVENVSEVYTVNAEELHTFLSSNIDNENVIKSVTTK